MFLPKTQSVNNEPHFSLKKHAFLIMFLVCSLLFIYPQESYAEGVEAGTSITNIATVTYTVENVLQAPINSSPTGNSQSGNNNGAVTQFVVDRKIDLVVTGNSNANVNPGDAQAEVTFTLQNQGNATQEFSLTTDNLLTSDNFDPNSCITEVTGVTGTPVSGVVLPTTGNIKLSADQQASISVKCDIPLDDNGSAISSGETALIGLIATVERNEDNTITEESTSAESASTVDTVFADGSGSDDADNDAQHSDRRTYIASSGTLPPTLSLDKSIVSVRDPNGGNTAITGSEVTYKIQINSTGTGTIENVVITDPTPADMTYKIGSIILNNTNQSDAIDADNSDFGLSTADTATINLGNFSAGNQYEIQLTYIIN